MIQRFVVSLIRMVANTFFRRIDVVGLENIPADGPLIFAGNHPNALMDGWLLTAKCGRWPLHFLANAKLWEYRLMRPLLDVTGAVPVYRREEHDGKVDNQQAFDKVYEILEAGKFMGIFPEGVSHTESQLIKLKTGTARIALAVAARGKTNVKIVPCGLNYIHRHRFRSQVLIEFGEPISIGDKWARDYEKDNQATVLQLTEHPHRSGSNAPSGSPRAGRRSALVVPRSTANGSGQPRPRCRRRWWRSPTGHPPGLASRTRPHLRRGTRCRRRYPEHRG